MLSKCCTQYVSKSGRLSSGHRTGRDQFSSQFPRRAVLKIVQIVRQLHSSPMLVRSCLKSCMLGFSIMWTKNLQISKLGLEKEDELEIKLPTFAGLSRKQGNFRKTSISGLWTTLNTLTVWIMKALRWEYQTILPVPWQTYMWIKKQQLEPSTEQLIGLRWRNVGNRAVCCHPVCLTYMLSTSWEMLGWISYETKSR